MKTKLKNMVVPANTRYRFEEVDPARPTVKRPIDKKYLTDAWIEITDIDSYKDMFPTYTHKICNYFEDWRVFVHKADPIFLTGSIYKELKQEIVAYFGLEVSAKAHKNKVHEDFMNLWELIDFVAEHLATDIVVDLDTLEIEYITLDKEVEIDYTEHSKTKLRDLCREKGLLQKGNKPQLIARLQEFNKEK